MATVMTNLKISQWLRCAGKLCRVWLGKEPGRGIVKRVRGRGTR